MVTDEEMQAIKAEHVHDPIIDGYYFDGSFYTDPTGDKKRVSTKHGKFGE